MNNVKSGFRLTRERLKQVAVNCEDMILIDLPSNRDEAMKVFMEFYEEKAKTAQ